jgi:hypothetical protein
LLCSGFLLLAVTWLPEVVGVCCQTPQGSFIAR